MLEKKEQEGLFTIQSTVLQNHFPNQIPDLQLPVKNSIFLPENE